jgi:hypothetical protein
VLEAAPVGAWIVVMAVLLVRAASGFALRS